LNERTAQYPEVIAALQKKKMLEEVVSKRLAGTYKEGKK